MTNPLIDAITWDLQNPSASAQNLQVQLTLLQAEWEEKRSRFLQITSVGQKSVASWEALANHRASERDNYVGLDPSIPLVDTNLRMIHGQLLPTQAVVSAGHSERRYLSQTSVKVSNASPNTVYLFQETVDLPRPAYVMGVHPLVVKSAGANPCNLLLRPLVDGSPIYSGTHIGSGPRPGISIYPLIVNSETYLAAVWACPDLLSVGSHTIEMDVIASSPSGLSSNANVAPFFNLYSSSIELGTMPITYVQPSLSYLEFIYQ